MNIWLVLVWDVWDLLRWPETTWEGAQMNQELDSNARDDQRTARRTVLKGAVAAAGVAWAVPTIDSFVSPAAAASGTTTTTTSTTTPPTTTATANLQKDPNGTLTNRCLQGCSGGGCSNAGRGSAIFSRTGNQISVTITLTSGPGTAGREIWIMQTDGVTCQNVLAGTWAGTPLGGPQTFTATISPGMTKFSVHNQASGGGGTDIYTSYQVTLP